MAPLAPSPEIPRAAIRVLRDVAGPCTLPLVIGAERPTDIGTGVFFEAAGVSFILAAAHTVEKGARDGSCISVPCPRGAAPIIDNADVILPKTAPLDCAVVKLSAENHAALVDGGFVPLRQNVLDAAYHPNTWPPANPAHFLCLFGFPAATTEWDPTRRAVSVGRRAFTLLPHDGSGPPGFDPRYHIALSYPRTDEVSIWQLDGSRVQAIKPGGFSGCGVWSLPLSRELAWQPSDVRLVALQHAWVEGYRAPGAVRCTRISVAIGMIRKAIPDLAPTLDLVFPAAQVLSPGDVSLVHRIHAHDGSE